MAPTDKITISLSILPRTLEKIDRLRAKNGLPRGIFMDLHFDKVEENIGPNDITPADLPPQ